MKLLLRMMLSVLLLSTGISSARTVTKQPEVQDISGQRVALSAESLSGPGIFLIVKDDSGIVFWTLSDAKALLAILLTDTDIDERLANIGMLRNFLADRNPLVTDSSKHQDVIKLFKRFAFEPKKLSDFGSRWGIALPTVMSDVFDVAEQSIQSSIDLSVIDKTGDILVISECSDEQRANILKDRSSGHSRFPFLYVLPEAGRGQKKSTEAKRSPEKSQGLSSMGVVGGVVAGVVGVATLVWNAMQAKSDSKPDAGDPAKKEAELKRRQEADKLAAAQRAQAEAEKERARVVQELERPHSALLDPSRPKVEHRAKTPSLLDEEDAALVVAHVLEGIVTKFENEHIEPVPPAKSVPSPFRPVSCVNPNSSGPGHEDPFAGSDVPPVTPLSSHHSGSSASNPVHTPVPVKPVVVKSPFSSPASPISAYEDVDGSNLSASLPSSPFAGSHDSGLGKDDKLSESGFQLGSAFKRRSPSHDASASPSSSFLEKSTPRSPVAAAVDVSAADLCSGVNTSLQTSGSLNVSRRSRFNTLIINGKVVVIPPVPQTLSPDVDAQEGAPFPSTLNTTVVNITKPGLVAGPAKLRASYDSVQSDDIIREQVDRAGVGFRPGHKTLQTPQVPLQAASGHDSTLNLDGDSSSFIERERVPLANGDDLDVSKIEGDGDSGTSFVEDGDEELVKDLGSVVGSSRKSEHSSGANESALVVRTAKKILDVSQWNSAWKDTSGWFSDDESNGTDSGSFDDSLLPVDRSDASWKLVNKSLASAFAVLHKSGIFTEQASVDESSELIVQCARRYGVELDEDSRESSRRFVASIAKNTIFYSFVNSSDDKTYYFAFDQFKRAYANASSAQRAELCMALSSAVACRFKKFSFVGAYDFLPDAGRVFVETMPVVFDARSSLSVSKRLADDMCKIFGELGENPRMLDDRYAIVSDRVRGNIFKRLYDDVNFKDLLKRVLGIELVQDAGSFNFNVEIQDKPMTMADFIKIAAMQRLKMYPFHYLVRKDQHSFDQSMDASRFEDASD